MRYTFADAKRILESAGQQHGTTDIGDRINAAVQSLAGLNGWDFMRRLSGPFPPALCLPSRRVRRV